MLCEAVDAIAMTGIQKSSTTTTHTTPSSSASCAPLPSSCSPAAASIHAHVDSNADDESWRIARTEQEMADEAFMYREKIKQDQTKAN